MITATTILVELGYSSGVSVDAPGAVVASGTVEEINTQLRGWIDQGGLLIAHWTVEAGCVPEFLRDPMVAAFLEVEANLAMFCQRKIDAREIETALRRRIFKH